MKSAVIILAVIVIIFYVLMCALSAYEIAELRIAKGVLENEVENLLEINNGLKSNLTMLHEENKELRSEANKLIDLLGGE